MRLRRFLFCFVLLVGMTFMTRVSYADDTGRYTEHPYVYVDDWNEVDSEVSEMVPPIGEELACGSGYDAAAWCFGTDPRTLSDLQKAYLSDSNFCPNFCSYAESFACTWPSINLLGVAQTGYVYESTGFSKSVWHAAQDEFEDILDENYPSSGSGADAVSTVIPLSVYPFSVYSDINTSSKTVYYKLNNPTTSYYAPYTAAKYNNAPYNYNYAEASDFSITISDTVAQTIGNYLAGDYVGYFVELEFRSGKYNLYIWMLREGDSVESLYATVSSGELAGSYLARHQINSDDEDSNMFFKGQNVSFSSSDWPDDVGGLASVIRFESGSWSSKSGTSWTTQNYNVGYYYSGWGNGGDPTGDWPDNPSVEPKPDPDVPDPDPDPIPDPDPVPIPEPGDPVIHIDEPTEWTDYVPWLRAILAALNSINVNLAEHCYHIRLQISNSISWLYDSLKSMFSTLFSNLNNYLRDLFVWLAEELKAVFTGSPIEYDEDSDTVYVDTSSLANWLRLIYYKLDDLVPKSDPLQGFWDLLNSILAGIISGLVAGALGLLGGMASAVEGLATKFPFSLPWDLITIVGLFAHDPVTPIFDLPLALPDGNLGAVHVDLSDWDSVMVSVRAVQVVLFGYGLARKTPDVVQMLDSIFTG